MRSAPLTPLASAALTHKTRATEIVDNGYPQILAPEALKLYITQEGVRSDLAPFEVKVRSLGVRPCVRDVPPLRPLRRGLQRRAMESRNATMQVTGAVSWRREGLKYKKNEVYLDIVESINVLMTAKGAQLAPQRCGRGSHAASCAGVVLRSDVSGKIQMKCFLTVRAVKLRSAACAAAQKLTRLPARRACRS